MRNTIPNRIMLADGSVTGTIVYSSTNLGTTNIEASKPTAAGFFVPVRSNAPQGIQTNVAIVNAEDKSLSLDILLRDQSGQPAANVNHLSASVQPGGRYLVSVRDMLPSGYSGDFRGTLEVGVIGGNGKITGVALESHSVERQLISYRAIPLR